jgi:hypothetical protein
MPSQCIEAEDQRTLDFANTLNSIESFELTDKSWLKGKRGIKQQYEPGKAYPCYFLLLSFHTVSDNCG